MRAIIIATGMHQPIRLLAERHSPEMLPLVDRPVVQHVVEHLVQQGILEMDVIVSHLPEKVEALLGDGTRWGAKFHFHLVKDPCRPYGALSLTGLPTDDSSCLLIHADRLVEMSVKDFPPCDASATVLLTTAGAGQDSPPVWTGWAVVGRNVLGAIPADADMALLETCLRAVASAEVACRMMDARTCIGLLEGQQGMLAGGFAGLMLSGWQADPGIWMAHGVVLHPTARLVPPVFLGDSCSIGKGCTVGPNVVVSHNCVLDEHSQLTRSLIMPGSYVGQGLELDGVLVDRNCLVNVGAGAATLVKEDFIIGTVESGKVHHLLADAFSRLLALALLLVLSPALLLTALALKLARRGPVLNRLRTVRLPADADETLWRSCDLLSFRLPGEAGKDRSSCEFIRGWLGLPSLWNVAMGQLSFVGVPPRTTEEVRNLPADWRALYLTGKSGIVTEALANFGLTASEDERYSSEAFYCVQSGAWHDLCLIGRHVLNRIMPGRLSASATEEGLDV